jgi:hypothetical protein
MSVLRLVVLFVALAWVSLACTTTTKTCTQVACNSFVSARATLDRPAKELAGGTVHLCVATNCTSATIEVAEAGVPESEVRCSGGRIGCSAARTSTVLEVNFGVTDTEETTKNVDLTVLAPTGETVASRKGIVALTRFEPNGPGCDPVCMQGELK